MSNSANSIFNHAVIGAVAEKRADAQKASLGLGSVFATMLAKEMRTALAGDEGGIGGLGGGAAGDIYSSFFDEAMGNALAGSKAFKSLNKMVERAATGPQAKSKSAASRAGSNYGLIKVSAHAGGVHDTGLTTSGAGATAPSSAPSSLDALPSDKLGPVLLPPPPSSVAPILPPPGDVEI